MKCRSKNGNYYYKCSNGCGKWWFEDTYELYLRDNHPNLLERFYAAGANQVGVPAIVEQGVQQPAATAVQGMVGFDLNMVLADMKLEIGNLKTEVKEMKDEVRKAKNPIVFDNETAVLFLAILVAVLVAIVCSK